jgi:hypothetical protein
MHLTFETASLTHSQAAGEVQTLLAGNFGRDISGCEAVMTGYQTRGRRVHASEALDFKFGVSGYPDRLMPFTA